MSKLPVHNYNISLGEKVFPCLLQRSHRFRNHRIGKTEQHPIYRRGQMNLCCVFLPQLDVVPSMAVGKLPGFCQHRVAAVDSKNFSGGTDGLDQPAKISAGPATHLKHLVTGLEFQSLYRFSSNVQRKPKQEVKQRVDRRQMIVAPTNKIDFVTETHN